MRTVLRFICGVGLLTSIGPAGSAQIFIVDDPATTEKGRFNLLMSYMSSQSKSLGEMQGFPNAMLFYGVTDRFELMLNPTAMSVRGAGARRATGLGETAFYMKYRFFEETARRPQMAFVYQPKLPTGNPGLGFGSGSLDHTLWISAGKSLGRLYLTTMGGYTFANGTINKSNAMWGASATYQLADKWQLIGEVYGNSASAFGGKDEFAWNAGFNYQYRPDKNFILALGRSQRGNSDFNVFVGINFNFGGAGKREDPEGEDPKKPAESGKP